MVSLTAFRLAAAAAAPAPPLLAMVVAGSAEEGPDPELERPPPSPGQSLRASPGHAGQAPPLALVAGVRLR